MHKFLICLFTLLPTHVLALSCMATDAVWLYQHIKEDEADYLLVKGTVSLTEAPNVPVPSETKPAEALTEARATGTAFSRSGFDVPFDQTITIRATCISVWCSTPDQFSDETHIFALKMEDGELVLPLSACGGFSHRWSEEQEQRVLDCHLNGTCPAPEF